MYILQTVIMRLRKSLAIILTLSLIISGLIGFGNIEKAYAISTPIEINSVSDFLAFANSVTKDNRYTDLTVNLNIDIDLSVATPWTPICPEGDSWNDEGFNGTFNGNGHTISNISINSITNNQGLFAKIGKLGTIKNLYLQGTVKGRYYVGLLSGINKGMVDNVECNVESTGKGYAGGVVGLNYGTVQNCSTTLNSIITGEQYSGGIVGWSNAGKIYNSYNLGSIISTNANAEYICCMGGIVGNSNYFLCNTYNVGEVIVDTGAIGSWGEIGTSEKVPWISNTYLYFDEADIENNSSGLGTPLPDSEIRSTLATTLNNNLDEIKNSDLYTWAQDEGAYPYLTNELWTPPISNVSITDIDTPSSNDVPDTIGTCNTSGVSINSITWEPSDKSFSYDTAYKVNVTIEASDTYRLANNLNISVNGNTASVTKNDDGTFLAEYEFSKTEKGNMSVTSEDVVVSYDGNNHGISVNAPTDSTVTYGENPTNCTLQESPTITTVADSPKRVYYEVTKVGYNKVVGSALITINIAAQPGLNSITYSHESIDGKNDGNIYLVNSTMEYRLRGFEYTGITGTQINNLTPGTYDVKYKENANCNPNSAVSLTIKKGIPQTYTIESSNVMFKDKAYGYDDIIACPITITSSGNWETTIKEVLLSGDAFELNKSTGTTIASLATDNTTYTVKPTSGLTVGDYEETVTIVYNNGKKTTSTVGFTVKALPVASIEESGASISGIFDADISQFFAKEELEQAALDGNAVKILIETKKSNPTRSLKELMEAETDRIGLYLDISVYKYIGEDRSKIEESPSEITITYTIPEELQDENKTFYIIREHQGTLTKLEDLDTKIETITFKTDKFSTYALAYTETPIDAVATGDHSLTIWVILLMVSLLSIALVTKRMYRN